MDHTPGGQALALAESAEIEFSRGHFEVVEDKLHKAFALKQAAEHYAGESWQRNHNDFTKALLAMAVLWYKLGHRQQGRLLNNYAQAWADDPNYSSKSNYDMSLWVRNHELRHILLGFVCRLIFLPL